MTNRRARRGSWLIEGVCILFLAFAVYLLVTNVLPTRRNLADLMRENERVGREIDDLHRERARLDLKADALQSDPYEIEKQLRETLRLTRPEEKVLR